MALVPLQIRPSDCDVYGHVNNAVYASYFEQALADRLAILGYGNDWQRDSPCFWAPQSLTLDYRQAATYGDSLQGHLWLARPDELRPAFGFEILRSSAQQDSPNPPLFRAIGSWTRNSRDSGKPQQIPAQTLGSLAGNEGLLPRERSLVIPSLEVRKYSYHHRVERSEAGPSEHIHLQPLYRLLEASLSDACDQAGWPVERWLAAGFFTVQTRHDTQVFTLPKSGEAIRIASQLIESHRLGGTWELDVHRASDGTLLARDFSTGVHLNLAGRPASPPAEILKDIQFG